jgi:hypothetical protein
MKAPMKDNLLKFLKEKESIYWYGIDFEGMSRLVDEFFDRQKIGQIIMHCIVCGTDKVDEGALCYHSASDSWLVKCKKCLPPPTENTEKIVLDDILESLPSAKDT